MSLVETKRGRPTGHRALDVQREEIIEKAIRKYYLKPTRPTVSQLVRDIETDCAAEGLKPPHRRTIERRLGDLDLRHRAQRRGEHADRESDDCRAGNIEHHSNPSRLFRSTTRRPTSLSSMRKPANRSDDPG